MDLVVTCPEGKKRKRAEERPNVRDGGGKKKKGEGTHARHAVVVGYAHAISLTKKKGA